MSPCGARLLLAAAALVLPLAADTLDCGAQPLEETVPAGDYGPVFGGSEASAKQAIVDVMCEHDCEECAIPNKCQEKCSWDSQGSDPHYEVDLVPNTEPPLWIATAHLAQDGTRYQWCTKCE